MTALVLVVDDLEPNVKLLQTKLEAEYYDVITASNGFEAITQATEHKPDIILLDVMMPEMDGFEACKRLKEDPETSHIPVIMVTALNEPSDRVQGLESGADDFLTKPINDVALFARLKSLVRLKIMIDELRLRDQTGMAMGVPDQASAAIDESMKEARVLVIDDDVVQGKQMVERLGAHHRAELLEDVEDALNIGANGSYSLIIVSTQMFDVDGLRLCSQFRSQEATRHVPLLIMVEEDDQRSLVKGLELGVNDYIITPVDFNELIARARTQIRRKFYQDALKSNYRKSISMAITDNLTGLYNRHYLDTHLDNLVSQARETGKPLGLVMMDMDHFKSVNDTYGHAVGDEVLVELAKRIVSVTRGSDLVARVGGEEFVVVMPETEIDHAVEVGDRIRKAVESLPFKISHEQGYLDKTISLGMAFLKPDNSDTVDELMKRADDMLYKAKNSGRNRLEVQYNS